MEDVCSGNETTVFTRLSLRLNVNLETDVDQQTAGRSSHRRWSVIKVVLKSFAKFIGKCLCRSLFFNNAVGLRATTLLKERPDAFLWVLRNFKNTFFTEYLRTTASVLITSVREKKGIPWPRWNLWYSFNWPIRSVRLFTNLLHDC